MKITLVAGARPNFMKIAPIIEAIENRKDPDYEITYRLVHTGQHYDKSMSGSFFEQLGIPEPDVNLEAGGGTQAEQTANIMVRFEKDLLQHPTDLLIVVGDVTSTLACSIVAKKLGVKVAHVEAGIRSGDMSMPEEINRMVTDAITDYFFTTSQAANDNLLKNGVASRRIFFVGNTMIDTLLKQLPNLQQPSFWKEIGLQEKEYIVLTLHRPANVDNEVKLKELLDAILSSSGKQRIIFPVHPRTNKILERLGFKDSRIHMIEPLGYLEFNYLVRHAKAVVTDSGGITEETTVMGIPCMTLRDNTERPETCTIGTNVLLGTDPAAIPPAFKVLFDNKWQKGGIPPLWDGNAAARIVDHIVEVFRLEPVVLQV